MPRDLDIPTPPAPIHAGAGSTPSVTSARMGNGVLAKAWIAGLLLCIPSGFLLGLQWAHLQALLAAWLEGWP